MFEVPVLAMLIGGLLLLIGVVGGGFEVKELKIPKVANVPRAISALLGLMMVGLGLSEEGSGGTGIPNAAPVDVAAAAFAPTGATGGGQPAATPVSAIQPPPAVEQPTIDEHREMVLAQLEAATIYWEDEGFRAFASDDGALEASAEEQFTIDVTAGREYVVSAFCDDDCSDIDLVLNDAAGNLIDDDLELDATPIVTGIPAVTGTYTLTVRVVNCTQAPCRFAVGVFER